MNKTGPAKHHSFALVAALLWLAGCSTTVNLHGDEADAGTLELVQRSWQHPLQIILRDGSSQSGRQFEIERDTLHWRHAETGEQHATAIAGIREITHTSRWQGAMQGGLAGAAVGCGVGFYASRDIWDTFIGAFILCPMIGGMYALPGAGIGALIGDRTTYHWQPPESAN